MYTSKNIQRVGNIGQETIYDDLAVGISNVKLPAVSAPDDTVAYAYGIGGGVTFPALGFAVGELVYFDIQTPHGMKLNTPLELHIHYTLPNTTDVGHYIKFQLDVIAAGVDGTYAVPSGSPFTAETTVAANDNTNQRILHIANIPAVNTTVSTIYKCKLTRIDATDTDYSSDVYITSIDCHYQKDQVGSRTEYVK